MCDKHQLSNGKDYKIPPILSEEEYQNELNRIEEDAEEDINSFFKFETVNLMRKLVKYENEKTKEIFDSLKEVQKRILITVQESGDVDALKNMINSADSPNQMLNIYQSNRYTYLVEQLKLELDRMDKLAKENITNNMTEAFSRGFIGAGYNLSQIVPSEVINDGEVPMDQINSLVEMPYYGETLYDRLSDTTNQSLKRIKGRLLQGLIAGKAISEISKEITKALKTSFERIQLINRTEIMRSSNSGIMSAYKNNKHVVKGFIYMATLDLKTCSICGSYDGNEYGWGETKPVLPLHPRCRCVYSPKLISPDVFKDRFGVTVSDFPLKNYNRPTWNEWMARQIKRGNLDNANLINKVFNSRENFDQFKKQFI